MAGIAFWWNDWPGSRLGAPWTGVVDTLLVAAIAVVLTIAGQAVNTAVVLDFMHLNRILAVDPDARTIETRQAPVVTDGPRGQGPARLDALGPVLRAETCFFNDKSLCPGHGLPPLAFRICGIWSSGHDAVLYPDYRWIAGRVRRSEAAGTEQCRRPV